MKPFFKILFLNIPKTFNFAIFAAAIKLFFYFYPQFGGIVMTHSATL